MGDAGYRGVSADQDGRFRNKEQKMLKNLQFPAHFDQKVDMSRVNMDVMKAWIGKRVEEVLGFEDDVVAEYAVSMLEEAKTGLQAVDPRKMQLNLTGFLEAATPAFASELWTLLLSAQKSIGGIPQEFVEQKKEELRRAREQDAAAIASSGVTRRAAGQPRDRRGDFDRSVHPRRSRWNEQPRDARRQDFGHGRDFIDKSGNRTERVHDSGWPSASSGDRYDRRRADGDVRPPRGDARAHGRWKEGPDHRRTRYGHERRPSPPRRKRSYSPSRSRSRSPVPLRPARDERSVTPQWRPRARSRSPSVTPPRRLSDRSPTYSPQPSWPLQQTDSAEDGSKVKKSRWDRAD